MTIEEMKKRGYITQTTTPEQILDMAKFVTQTAVMRELLKYAKELEETIKDSGEVPENPVEIPEKPIKDFEEPNEIPLEIPGIISRTTSPELMDIAVAQGWCENPDYLTQEEVEKIMSINGIDFSSLSSFDEFEYFIGVTKLSSNFTNCNITSITLPKSITYIGKEVFAGCKKLAKITSLASVAPGIAKSTFNGLGTETDTRILYIPSDATGYEKWNIDYIIEKL